MLKKIRLRPGSKFKSLGFPVVRQERLPTPITKILTEKIKIICFVWPN